MHRRRGTGSGELSQRTRWRGQALAQRWDWYRVTSEAVADSVLTELAPKYLPASRRYPACQGEAAAGPPACRWPRDVCDSAERRHVTVHEPEARGIDQNVVAKRMRADVSQGRPATEAVKATGRFIKARRSGARGTQAQHEGLTR